MKELEAQLIGDRTAEAQEHLRACDACRSELARLELPFQSFGDAVRQWSSRQAEVRSEVRRPESSSGRGLLRMPLAAAAAVLIAAVPVYFGVRSPARVENPSVMPDSALLERVQAGIARSVPQPLEPLSKLMSLDSTEGKRSQ